MHKPTTLHYVATAVTCAISLTTIIGIVSLSGCASSDAESGFEDDKGSIGDFFGFKKYTQPYPGGAREEYWLRRTLDGEWIRHGDYTRWHANGKKHIHAYYFNGEQVGKMRMWDEAGNLMSERSAD